MPDRAASSSLRRRLVATLAIALTPVLLLGAASAYMDAREALRTRSNELLLIAGASVDGVDQTIDEAELLLGLFKDEVGSRNCSEVYNKLLPSIPALSSIIRFDADGVALCASNRDAGFTMSDMDWNKRLRHEVSSLRTDAFFGQATEDWVFGIFSRVDKADGTFDGSVALGLRSRSLASFARASVLSDDVEVAIADGDGRVFGSTHFSQIDQKWVTEAAETRSSKMFVLRRKDASPMDVVIRPVGPANVFAVISRESPGFWSEFTLQPVSSFGLPLLAFSIALLAVWLAIDSLVLRWLSRLIRIARVYGAGRYAFRAGDAMASAPAEIKELADALEDMAADIDQRDSDLKSAISVRDAAVKEIHHRVKNNLQIVTSFLNLQGRQLQDPEARQAIAAARHRIDALAIVHQTLYQHERLELVSMQPFLEGLINHLAEALGTETRNIGLSQTYEDLERPADDAIPFALFLVEAVTNATKYAFNDDEGGMISITLEEDNTGGIILKVMDDGVGFDPGGGARVGLGSKLMKAFSRQLHAELTIDSAPGEGTRITLFMPGSK
ncbi:sensor histidine kinase [Hyphomonas jannaschiana]|uniref:histidine kinase n=1 Tax=Hyphomonas jannaschiana VP2 TaxID=1280952 RepID=A0A059FG32_9PROT|nr:sensor histidine kinase [Hyphomonas jannaschiana]KCZ89547.1 signal transduction histidine kinase [Hyphomonas jannaschiana VP2]